LDSSKLIHALITQTIERCSEAIEKFKKALKNLPKQMNPWIPFIWISKINLSTPPTHDKLDVYDLINFVATLDDFVEPYNSLIYNFFSAKVSGIVFNKKSDISQAFMPNATPFVILRDANKDLGFEVTLLRALIKSVNLELAIEKTNYVDVQGMLPTKPCPKTFQLQFKDEKEAGKYPPKWKDPVTMNHGDNPPTAFKASALGENTTAFKVTIKPDEDTNVLRIKNIIIKGTFA
jgi:hypothetical protein